MDSSKEFPKDRTLNSWKEIANCLGVTVRSVQRWEQTAGLPVYRQGTGSKARVFAYPDELLAWRERRGEQDPEPAPAAEAAPTSATANAGAASAASALSRRLRYCLWAGGAVLAAALAFWGWRAGSPPSDWLVERGRLKILDSHGQVLWEKRFPSLGRRFETESAEKVVISDIDGDGDREVLFNYIPEDPAKTGGSLLCFNSRGRLRWETRFGAVRTFGDRKFTQSYLGRFLRPVKVAGKPRLLTVSTHYLWYPAQVALLDPADGRVLEDYWHPGVIYHCLLHDVDRDGAEEVLLAGINNPGSGLGHAALAVLKLPFSTLPRRERVPVDPLSPMLGGRELAYVLFPVPDTSRVMGVLPIPLQLSVDQHERILVQNPVPDGAVVYYLRFDFTVDEYRLSDGFPPSHNRLHKQGLLDHPLTPAETAALGKVLRFPSAPDGNRPELDRFWKF